MTKNKKRFISAIKWLLGCMVYAMVTLYLAREMGSIFLYQLSMISLVGMFISIMRILWCLLVFIYNLVPSPYEDYYKYSMNQQSVNDDALMHHDMFNQQMNMYNDTVRQFQEQQFQQFSMDEAMKSVTPFDHGGYVQGPGFNPSDSMSHDFHMNNMNMF